MTLARGDGTTLLAEVFMGAAFGDNGASPLSTTIVRDLAAHKAAEVELEEYRHRLEDLLKERAAEMREAAARVRREADERRLAEAETQATERRFQVLVERSSDVILVLDDTDHVSYCSPSVERLMGYRQDEITGMVVDKFIHSDDLVHVEAVRRGLRAKSPAEFQAGTLRVHTKDGSLRWLEWSVSGHYDDDAIHGSVVNARDVTERVLAERSLRDSEERYRTLTEASPDMIYLVGADCRVQYVNGQAAQRFGVSAERLIGRPIAEMFEGVTGARIVAAVEQVLASGEPYEADSMIAYPDGDRWVCTRLVALKEDGRVSGVLGVSQDVTDRRLAQDALAESERRYRSLFEDSPVAMWEEDYSAIKAHLTALVASGIDDVAGYLREHPAEYERCVGLARTLDVNRAAVALYEAASREELLDRAREIYPPDFVGGLPSFWAAMLAGERSASYEEINVTLAGRALNILETCIVAPGHETTGDRIYLADVDVTERRRAADLLGRYRLLFAEARDIMLFVRAADGRIVEANAAAEATYGYSRQELLELDISGLRTPDQRAEVGEQLEAATAGGVLFESEHRRKDGSAFPVEVSSRGIVTVDGETLLLSVIRDISDRKRTENELRQTMAHLQDTLKATVAALGGMAELRDPYTAGHQRRVAELSCAIAGELGWDARRIESLRTAALMHDIGKTVVPAEILSKPGRLSETEMLLIRQHAGAGADILAGIDFEDDIAEMVRQHHERLDGSGYPAGLKDAGILSEARILAVADVVEAMVSHRPYRAALPLETAMAEIESGAGSRYDAAACEAALRLFREKGFSFSE